MDVLINDLINQWGPIPLQERYCTEYSGNDVLKSTQTVKVTEDEVSVFPSLTHARVVASNAWEEKIPISLHHGNDVHFHTTPAETSSRHNITEGCSRDDDKVLTERGSNGVDDKIAAGEEEIEQAQQSIAASIEGEASGANALNFEDTRLAEARSDTSIAVDNFRSTISAARSPDIASPKFPVVEQSDRLDQELLMPDGIDKEVVMQSAHTDSTLSSPISRSSLQMSYQEFSFYYTNSYTNVVVTNKDQQAMFFSEVSTFSKGVPDVQLRNIAQGPARLSGKGEDLKAKDAALAKVVAVADFLPSSNHIRLGFGYLDIPESINWAVMKCIDPTAGAESWEMTLSVDQSPDRKYQWIRGGRNLAQTGEAVGAPSDSKTVYTMRSETGILATLRSTNFSNWRKRGVLRIHDVPEAEDLHLAIILSFTALSEKLRRQTWKRNLSLRRAPSKKF